MFKDKACEWVKRSLNNYILKRSGERKPAATTYLLLWEVFNKVSINQEQSMSKSQSGQTKIITNQWKVEASKRHKAKRWKRTWSHVTVVRIFWESEVKDGTFAGFDNQWLSLGDDDKKK